MTDDELVHRLLAGDSRAFRHFMDQHSHRLAAFIARRCADRNQVEDLTQATLLRAIRAMAQFRAEASLHTWLCQIASSEMIDQGRRGQRRLATVSLNQERVGEVVANMPDPQGSPGGLPEAMLDEPVLDTLRRLPPNYARALEWKYGDDASVAEIGRMLGVSDDAAQSLLARARRAFREHWQQLGHWSAGGGDRHDVPGSRR
jgi:RNA polymerase sigma-70 factor (ECF subfamily)